MRCDTLPLSVVFQCLSTPLPHSGVSPSPSLPTYSERPLVRPRSPAAAVFEYLHVWACVHTRWQDFPMTGFTIPPPAFSPALPCLLAPLAPMDTVLNYLIDDSSPVTLFLLFYCYNTTPSPSPSSSLPFMAINTQCGGSIKNPQDLNSGVFTTFPFSTLRTYKQA